MTQPNHTENCWNRIGMAGDGSCARLEQVIHCRNCDRYAEVGRTLLDRPAPRGYRAEWTRLLAEMQDHQTRSPHQALVFRIGEQYLALWLDLVDAVCERAPAHRIPHQSAALAGLINVDGELHLCVNLARILRLPDEPAGDDGTPRTLLIRRGGAGWAFDVDDVLGITPCPPEDLQPPPTTLDQSPHSHAQGLFPWQGHRVCLLDNDLLINELDRSIA